MASEVDCALEGELNRKFKTLMVQTANDWFRVLLVLKEDA